MKRNKELHTWRTNLRHAAALERSTFRLCINSMDSSSRAAVSPWTYPRKQRNTWPIFYTTICHYFLVTFETHSPVWWQIGECLRHNHEAGLDSEEGKRTHSPYTYQPEPEIHTDDSVLLSLQTSKNDTKVTIAVKPRLIVATSTHCSQLSNQGNTHLKMDITQSRSSRSPLLMQHVIFSLALLIVTALLTETFHDAAATCTTNTSARQLVG